VRSAFRVASIPIVSPSISKPLAAHRSHAVDCRHTPHPRITRPYDARGWRASCREQTNASLTSTPPPSVGERCVTSAVDPAKLVRGRYYLPIPLNVPSVWRFLQSLSQNTLGRKSPMAATQQMPGNPPSRLDRGNNLKLQCKHCLFAATNMRFALHNGPGPSCILEES
jgi:hypothetical protein